MNLIFSYFASLAVLLVLDFFWLGYIAKDYYKESLGHLFRQNPIWGAIIIFYIFYAAAVTYFAIADSGGSVAKAAMAGAILGGTAYMTYDLVNYSTLRGWPLSVVFADIAWGIAITAAAAALGAYAGRF